MQLLNSTNNTMLLIIANEKFKETYDFKVACVYVLEVAFALMKAEN